MGAHAVGAYLRVLREARGMGRLTLAKKIGIGTTQIEQLEKAVHTPRGPFLFAVAHAVQGNLEHVDQLMLDPDATAEAGRQLAHEWLVQQRQQAAQPALWQQAEEILAQVRHDPSIMDRLLGYAECLLEEEAAPAAESGSRPDAPEPQGAGSRAGNAPPG